MRLWLLRERNGRQHNVAFSFVWDGLEDGGQQLPCSSQDSACKPAPKRDGDCKEILKEILLLSNERGIHGAQSGREDGECASRA
jgi:hypothetical protein